MLPKEFLALYGNPTWERVVITPSTPLQIQQSNDRYLLVFWATSAAANINPEPGPAVDGPGLAWGPADQPVIITHALHGALCNKSWTVTTGLASIAVQIIQGFMRSLIDE